MVISLALVGCGCFPLLLFLLGGGAISLSPSLTSYSTRCSTRSCHRPRHPHRECWRTREKDNKVCFGVVGETRDGERREGESGGVKWVGAWGERKGWKCVCVWEGGGKEEEAWTFVVYFTDHDQQTESGFRHFLTPKCPNESCLPKIRNFVLSIYFAWTRREEQEANHRHTGR